MLVENAYPEDPRVRNEARLLTSSGYQVSVIGLRRGDQPRFEVIDGVRVYRAPRLELFQKTPHTQLSWLGGALLKVKCLFGYLFEYLYFTSACLAISFYVFLRHGFDVIHAHNPPDTLFLVALPFKLFGKKFVFDHHDLSPELYQSRYGADRGIVTRLLSLFEWCSLQVADLTIATNQSYKRVHVERGGRVPDKVFIVRNGPDHRRMSPASPSQRLRDLSRSRSIFCYVGSLNPQDGVDYLLRALHHLLYHIRRKDFYCVIMGTGDSLHDLRCLAEQLGLNSHVELTGYIPDEELRSNLAAADICVDPDPSSPLNDASTWIKIMEYMAFSKPIVTFDLKETRFSAQDAAVYVKPNNEAAFAEALAQLMDHPEERKRMGECGRRRVEQELAWSKVGKNLLAAYSMLLPRR
jgi:glycosyltransferase involved in cell wall biosynthesis